MSPRSSLLVACSLTACVCTAVITQVKRDGYKDTPILPGQKWHVHDSDRPYPPEVTPGETVGAPPSDAVVLFDGTDLSHWTQFDRSGREVPQRWKMENGTIAVGPGTGPLVSKEKFGDCQVHIEWQEDPQIQGSSQGRGNSGVFLMGRYEIQVLDSYHSATYADGQAGALYGQWPPLVNPMRKPGQWQSYDIVWQAPKWGPRGDTPIEPAYVTVFFNGVLVHNHQKLNGPTGHRVVLPYKRHDAEEAIALQDHGPAHPPHFRNIWVRRIKPYDQP